MMRFAVQVYGMTAYALRPASYMYACVCCISLIKNSCMVAMCTSLQGQLQIQPLACIMIVNNFGSVKLRNISFYKYTFIIIIMVYNHLSLSIYISQGVLTRVVVVCTGELYSITVFKIRN